MKLNNWVLVALGVVVVVLVGILYINFQKQNINVASSVANITQRLGVPVQVREGGSIDYLAKVQSWDKTTGILTVIFNSNNKVGQYALDPREEEIVTFSRTVDNQLNQILVLDRVSGNWVTAFCKDDKVSLKLEKINNSLVLKSVTNIGPRGCQ